MKKDVKIILYCVLAVILIVICCLVRWKSNQQAWEPENFTTEEEIVEIEDTTDTKQPSQNFEQDVMNDLESFFNDNNGYENIQWEFWFINSEN